MGDKRISMLSPGTSVLSVMRMATAASTTGRISSTRAASFVFAMLAPHSVHVGWTAQSVSPSS